MKEPHVLLHVGPHGVPETDRATLRKACADARVSETADAKPLDEIDGRDVDVLVTELIPHTLSNWPRLRFVQLFSAGMNHLAKHPIWETEIPVATGSGTHSVPIAQYVTCTLLMMAHHMPHLLALMAKRQWRPQGSECSSVRGQTVGIIGYGSIGRECGRQLSALGMRVLCMKRNPENRGDDGFNAWAGTGDPGGKIPEKWFGPTQLHEMLPSCDALAVTTASTPETLGLIGRSELALLKRGARVVIVSRGGIVDEPALAEALRSGHLAGAAVDCFTKEPLPNDHVFFDTPNLILTPHMSGVHDQFWPVIAELLRENLARFRRGEPLFNLVNRRLGY